MEEYGEYNRRSKFEDMVYGAKEWISLEENKAFLKKNAFIFTVILLTIISGSANNILFKKISIPFENYPFFLVLYSSVFSVPIYWVLIIPLLVVPSLKKHLTAEMMAFPMHKFAVLGLLDSLQGVMGFLSDSHIPGATQQLVQQLVVPITMAASVLVLRTTYSIGQYTGAAVILAGIVVDVVPAFYDPGSDLAAPIGWLLVFASSSVPFALSYLYKEIIFKDLNMSVLYLMAMDTNFQAIFNVLLTPLDAVPYIGTSTSFTNVYENLYNGCKCLFGTNSLPGDDCAGSWFLMVQYAFFNVMINLCLLVLLRLDSASFMFLAMTITVPIANICFVRASPSNPKTSDMVQSFHWIMGSEATALSWYDIAALVMIVGGLLLYRFTSKEELKKEKSVEDGVESGEKKSLIN